MSKYQVQLKKSEVKAYMYKGQYPNKEAFWTNVESKRVARAALKKIAGPATSKPAVRYAKNVPAENKEELKTVLLHSLEPANYEFIIRAGSSDHCKYAGTYNDGQYSSRCTYHIKRHQFILSVPRILTIEHRCIDGLYNVHCKKLRRVGVADVYEAAWIQRHRGMEFDIVHGYIASNRFGSYHANTIKLALKGLERKTKKQVNNLIGINDVIDINRFMQVTGACKPGCLDFLGKLGLPEDTKMTVEELIPLLQKNRQAMFANRLKMALK